ncbi:uncharacterized protein [Miscanthus floridulus]|uniref:uncharacterized protein n=1 Tax=Miscanthus floridulus TaxID=154761 RepID=UPI00345B18D5
MRIVADEHPAGAWCMDWSAEYLAVLEEARRRLEEVQHDAGGELVPGAGSAAAADESSDTAGADDFYPLDDADADEPEEERPMQWQDQVCRQMVYNYNSSRHLRQDDDDLVGHLADTDNYDLYLNDDDDDGDEISRDIVALGLHVPHIQQAGTATPPPFVPSEGDADGDRGFGAVPASAAAIAGLKEHRYDGSSGGDSMCVICMRSYKKGRRLRVMPCTHKHRFHGRCIREWLSRSNMCPLCRHALPTADAEQGGNGGVHRRVLVVRVNVNPY